MTDTIDGTTVAEEDVTAGDAAPPPAAGGALAVQAPTALVARGELTIDELLSQKELVTQAMSRAMRENEHYGRMPGAPATAKAVLLKPGAELLCVLFRFAPHYSHERQFATGDLAGHLTVFTKCELKHIPTGLVVATGDGSCSTLESRYRYRKAGRVCPICESPSIRKSKYPPKGAPKTDPGGWWCPRDTGCGAEFPHDHPQITNQETGRVENEDLPDLYNTVIKMAAKRALVAAILNGTAASDAFTQDMDDDLTEPDGSSRSDAQPPAETGGSAAKPAGRGNGSRPASGPENGREEKPAGNGDGWPNTQKGILDRFVAAWPDVDWRAWLTEYVAARFGKPSTQLTPDDARAVLTETRFAYEKLVVVSTPGEFPQPTSEEVQTAFYEACGVALRDVTLAAGSPAA